MADDKGSAVPQQQQQQRQEKEEEQTASLNQELAPALELLVVEPWFSLLQQGYKTVEGRLARNPKYEQVLEEGSIIVFRHNPSHQLLDKSTQANASFKARVTRVRKYTSFEQYLTREGLGVCLPGVASIKDGVAVYRQFYTKEDEEAFGVLAIHIDVEAAATAK